MILFFGTRSGKPKAVAIAAASCPFCSQKDTLKATIVPQYVHLFWIPVLRLKPSSYVECSHCKKFYEGRDLNFEMRQALEQLK